MENLYLRTNTTNQCLFFFVTKDSCLQMPSTFREIHDSVWIHPNLLTGLMNPHSTLSKFMVDKPVAQIILTSQAL